MLDGKVSPMVEFSTSDSLSVAGDDDHTKLVSEEVKTDKDPRRIARKYQLELCEKALQENVIVWLGTGCGKTHIAVLLMYEMGHLIRKPKKNICVFLAPTVALAQQQAKVIEDSLDFKVRCYCGSSKSLKSRQDWGNELNEYEVLVMTPKTLFHSLSHCYIKMDSIELLIFDECHHAQVNSNHPYAEIMKVFYKPNGGKLPRIFGMTASPVVGKGASNPANLAKTINSLEHILDAKVYSVESKEDLDRVVASPVLVMYDYGTNVRGSGAHASYISCCSKLVDIKRQCITILSKKEVHLQHQRNTKKLLSRMHDNLMFCLENLGIWGALQACHVLGDHSERDELVEVEKSGRDDSLCDNYLAQVAALLSSACGEGGNETDPFSVDFLREPFFSRKLLRLTGILSSFRLEPTTKCIIFVNRIVTARCLSCILQKLKILASWKSGFLVGIHSGLKSMSRKTTKAVLDKFRSGELNLLVATKVGEEGLDIQTCSLVIRFDLPETVASFIQSRGRARMPQSQYAFLVNSANTKDLNLIESFKRNEEQINFEVAFRTSDEVFISSQERVYKVDSSGATISSSYSIALLHHYCAKLRHDEYFDPKPMFFYFDDLGGTVCRITFPGNAPIHQIVSDPQSSMEAAKKDACLKAIEELHKISALNDFLLPGKRETNKQEVLVGSDIEEASHRGELHEMLVPSALRHAWTENDGPLFLHSYFIEFKPHPKDRDYKQFGFFIKTQLPFEAERMELDLHLARGRSVITKFVLLGLAEFDADQIRMAQDFQEMSLKLILDRSEFIPEFVTLGKNHSFQSILSTFYLLLPVLLHEHQKKMMVDWETVTRCLSSPVFRHPADVHEIPVSNGYIQLANGQRSMRDVENSLMYAPHKKAFYLITNVVHEKNGLSPLKDSAAFTHVDHFRERFSIDLKYPDQPLLRAKPLFSIHNLLHNRKSEDRESQELEEYFIYLPPELCELKIIGFSKDIASSLSLLPSVMHRLENLLVAIELKQRLSSSFPEGDQVSAYRILEALTTEKCQERLSLERLEILGDAFLKYAVARRLFLKHDCLDEGGLTEKRSEVVNNSNLCKLAISRNLQVYIRDQAFEPSEFFPLGRPCLRYCSEETQATTHSQISNSDTDHGKSTEARCSKNHHWLHKKTIADVVEALVGAFLVDSGFKAATAFLRWIGVKLEFETLELVNACRASISYIPLSSLVDVPLLEDNLGYWFLHQGLLLQALVHPSYSDHGGGCYQRLEFLGDAVLDYLITSYLYSVYPKLKPGQLTDLRSMFVNNKVFANVAADRSFHRFLICDSSSLSDSVKEYVDFFKSPEFHSGSSEGPKCPKALGDIVESCIGAVLLDSGFNLKSIWNIMLSFLEPIINCPWLELSPTRELQELCQFCNLYLEFQPSKNEGLFLVEAKASNNDVCVTASTTNISKKDAVIITSRILCAKLKAKGCVLKSKSLKEVIKSSPKMEAKLIGYDETPINVTPHAVTGNKKNVQSSFYPDSSIVPVSRQACSSTLTSKNTNSSGSSGGSCTGTARSLLYQICATNCWKPPSFECCKEEGPGHLKLFTYRVIVKIDDAPDLILESFGVAQAKKRDAAENAAEGALWYLKQEGYLVKNH